MPKIDKTTKTADRMIKTAAPASLTGETSPTDESLVESSKTGDDLAFRELMNRYVKPIFNFARQYSHNNEDSEDIAQDAFFKAWKHIKRFKKGRAFKPWIYAIARNTALDHVKKKRATVFSDLDDDENDIAFADTIADTEPLAHELFERRQSAEELDTVMDILHPDHRAVLVMHYREEMTFDEIAEATGKPMNTVKSWHRRALFKLRDRLAQTHH
jgi:RNA polymerase sigma-70 factor (ECF subfamily)